MWLVGASTRLFRSICKVPSEEANRNLRGLQQLQYLAKTRRHLQLIKSVRVISLRRPTILLQLRRYVRYDVNVHTLYLFPANSRSIRRSALQLS